MATGGDLRAANIADTLDNGLRLDLDLGATASITDRTELLLLGRLSLFGPVLLCLNAGLRMAYQLERWRTFFDVTATAYLGRLWTIGPRGVVGLQYELHPLVGVFSAFGLHIGWGVGGLRTVGDLTVGVQLRSFLLE